jgi:hypothetical protein
LFKFYIDIPTVLQNSWPATTLLFTVPPGGVVFLEKVGNPDPVTGGFPAPLPTTIWTKNSPRKSLLPTVQCYCIFFTLAAIPSYVALQSLRFFSLCGTVCIAETVRGLL